MNGKTEQESRSLQQSYLQMYGVARAEMHKSIELHAQHLWQFLTLLVGLLTLTLGAVGLVDKSKIPPGVILCVGGLVGSLVTVCGRAMCNRFYEGMLEGIVVAAKLEDVLEFEQRPDSANPVFPKDDLLLPDRWVASRRVFSSSQEFISASMSRGTNRIARLAFAVFFSINILLALGGVYLLWFGQTG